MSGMYFVLRARWGFCMRRPTTARAGGHGDGGSLGRGGGAAPLVEEGEQSGGLINLAQILAYFPFLFQLDRLGPQKAHDPRG